MLVRAQLARHFAGETRARLRAEPDFVEHVPQDCWRQGERNFGGAMVEHVLREVDPSLSFRGVHATRGKSARAEPVAALYEQGRVSHVGAFAALEDEMCTAIGQGSTSPDRLDALVWAISDLMLRKRPEPRVRSL